MKNTKKNKLLSLLLCGAMVFSTFAFLPARVNAADETQATEATQPTDTKDAASQTETKAQDTKADKAKASSQGTESKKSTASKTSTVKTVDFTKAAPFLDPVVGKTTAKKAKAAKSAKAASASDESTGVDNDGVVTNKTVTKNENGSYKIRLESYVTGASTTTTVTEDVPTDIVLVLDQSGSMADPFGSDEYTKVYKDDLDTSKTYYVEGNRGYKEVSWCETCETWTDGCRNYGWYHSKGTLYNPKTSDSSSGTQFYILQQAQIKLQALQDAVTSFCDSVADKANGEDKTAGTMDDVNHRIAIVGFGSDGTSNSNYYYTNTELFKGSTQTRYDNLTEADYTSAFQDMNTATGKSNVIKSIEALDAKGATRADLGMDMAKSILDKNSVQPGEKRNRVVIMFTDGSPTATNGFQLNVANDAITKAGEIKTAGTTVYSVGIFAGADATSAGTNPGGNLQQNSASLPAACNWFMQNLSSNNGTPQTPSYYLSASNSASLSEIFKQISDQIQTGGASVKLDSTTVVKDIVSDYFELPSGATASDITLKTADFDGYEADGETAKWKNEGTAQGVTASISDKTVNVTGFDFAANYVGIDDNNGVKSNRGKKLIIEFDVKVRNGFLGGNGVPSNGADSGIYTKKDGVDTVVENFEQPTVDVPVSKITAAASDKNVYLEGSLSASDIRSGVTVKAGSNTLDLTKDNFGLEPWQNAFVDISATVKDKNDNDILADDYDGMNNLTEDDSYTVSASIKAKSGDGGNAASATGKVNVFKPELTYKDSTAYYGDTAPTSYDSNMVGSALWKHGSTTDTDVVMTGSRPELTIYYDPAIGDTNWYKDNKISVKHDIPVKATVKIGNKNVTDHITFKHKNCAGSCGFDKDKEQFLIHVKACSLTVKKEGGMAGEPYVMNIYKDGAFYTSMTIVGNSSETIKELPVGTYTVQEDTDWAWRYKDPAPAISAGVGLSKNHTSGTITVENRDRYGSFLNGYSTVVKNVLETSK